jgi:ferredoxin-NADP reductase
VSESSGAAQAVTRTTVTRLLVQQVRREAEGVISIRLVDPAGGELPPWKPGAHLDVLLPSGAGVRPYSLCSDHEDRTGYTIAVLREENGRGGSRELHDTALVGRTIGVRGPRNHFELEEAEDYLLIAGGIGITPILSMVRQLAKAGRRHRLVYGGRSRRTMAFLDDLQEIVTPMDVVAQDELGLPDLDAALDQASPGTAVYCCGPEGLLRAVEAGCQRRGLTVHIERFVASSRRETDPDSPGASAAANSTDESVFEVELQRTGVTVLVPADRSVLDVVREHCPDVLFDCLEGYCGTCETPVVQGTVDHRDTILSEREREASDTMMICVSRSSSRRLVLDL